MSKATADEKSVRLHENGVRTLWDLLRVRGQNPAVGFNYILMNLVIEHGDELCLYLLNEHVVDVNATDLSGFTALHFATIEDSYELMAKLLSLGAHVNAQDEDGNTPLFYAFRYRVSAAAINLLLDHGAAPMIENKYGVRPIDLSGN